MHSIYALCDQLTYARAKISEFKLSINSTTRIIVVKSTQTLQLHNKLIVTNVEEYQSDSQPNNRRALVSYLKHIVLLLRILSPFSPIMRFQRSEKFRLMQNSSVVMKFITAFARDSVLSRWTLLATLSLCHFGIVPDVSIPPNTAWIFRRPHDRRRGMQASCSPLACIHLHSVSISARKPDCLPSMPQVLRSSKNLPAYGRITHSKSAQWT